MLWQLWSLQAVATDLNGPGCDLLQPFTSFGLPNAVHSLTTMTFDSEQLLVDGFVALLEARDTPWGDVQFTCEFDYSRGRTDVVVLHSSGQIMAFEAKLNKWRSALHQAYRNTCFAHRSFVLLPKRVALTAAGYRQEFAARGVGLCYLDSEGLVVVEDAPVGFPIEPWLASAAMAHMQQ